MDINTTITKVKDLVNKGNVSRIVIKKDEKEILNLPVSAGVVGAAVGLTTAKWVMLAGVLATIGFGCTVEIMKSDGNVINVLDEESNKKVMEFASETVEKVKEVIPVSINVGVKGEEAEPAVDADVVEVQEEEAAAAEEDAEAEEKED